MVGAHKAAANEARMEQAKLDAASKALGADMIQHVNAGLDGEQMKRTSNMLNSMTGDADGALQELTLQNNLGVGYSFAYDMDQYNARSQTRIDAYNSSVASLNSDLVAKQYSTDRWSYVAAEHASELKYYSSNSGKRLIPVDLVTAPPRLHSVANSESYDPYNTVKSVGDTLNKGIVGISTLDAIPQFSMYTTGKNGSAYLSTFFNPGGSTANTWAIGRHAPGARGVVGSYSGLQTISPVLKTSANIAGTVGTVLSYGLSAYDLGHEYNTTGSISEGTGTYNALQIAGTSVAATAAILAAPAIGIVSAPVAIGVGLAWGIGNLLIDSDASKAGWQAIWDNW